MWLLWKVLISLKNPNHDSSEGMTTRTHWGLIQISLNVRDIPQMVMFLCLLFVNYSLPHFSQIRVNLFLQKSTLALVEHKYKATTSCPAFVFSETLIQS